MTKSLVITLGNLGESLIQSAEKIIGHSDTIGIYCIDWDEPIDTSRKNISRRVEQMSDEHGLLLLTDIWGGTSTNIALDLRKPGAVEVVTGVNLPMVVTAQRLDDQFTLPEAAKYLRAKSTDAIMVAGGKV